MNISPLPHTLKSGELKAIYNMVRAKIASRTVHIVVHSKRAKAILTNIYLIVKRI